MRSIAFCSPARKESSSSCACCSYVSIFERKSSRVMRLKPARPFEKLLYFDGGTRVDELFLDRLRFFLVDAFLHGLRRAVHQVLCFFQAKAGNFANNFNHVDLVRAR